MKSVVLLIFAMVLAAEGASLNGNQKKKDDCECKSRPMEISFVVDNSASIWQANFTFGLNFIEDFVDLFDISQTAVRVSLVTFGEVVYTADAFGLSQFDNKEDLKAAISHIQYRAGSRTNTSGGIWYMLRQQMPEARPNVRHVAIVLTDGNSQETDLTIEAADDAHKAGLEVFAIGVGLNISAQELHNIASDNRHVFVVSTYNMLEGIKERLKYEACADEPYPVCKMDPVDLSFVIDSSLSIGEGNFTIGMAFVRDFVDHFEINPTAVRVSAVTFGDKVYTADAFGFTTYRSKKPLLDALEGIQWRQGQRTDTGDGIKYMRENQMSYARPEAAHVCIVITDGESQKTYYTAQQALEAQNQGIVMYAVGVGLVGEHLSEEELRNIAGSSKRVLTVNSYAELNLLKSRLATATCEGVMEALELKSQRYRE